MSLQRLVLNHMYQTIIISAQDTSEKEKIILKNKSGNFYNVYENIQSNSNYMSINIPAYMYVLRLYWREYGRPDHFLKCILWSNGSKPFSIVKGI